MVGGRAVVVLGFAVIAACDANHPPPSDADESTGLFEDFGDCQCNLDRGIDREIAFDCNGRNGVFVPTGPFDLPYVTMFDIADSTGGATGLGRGIGEFLLEGELVDDPRGNYREGDQWRRFHVLSLVMEATRLCDPLDPQNEAHCKDVPRSTIRNGRMYCAVDALL